MRRLRPAAPADVPEIVRLCAEHARFERAEHDGSGEVQWQTPSWNVEAIGFYERLGARGAAKVRFTAAVRPAEDAGTG